MTEIAASGKALLAMTYILPYEIAAGTQYPRNDIYSAV